MCVVFVPELIFPKIKRINITLQVNSDIGKVKLLLSNFLLKYYIFGVLSDKKKSHSMGKDENNGEIEADDRRLSSGIIMMMSTLEYGAFDF